MDNNNQNRSLVSAAEQAQIARAVVEWLNTYPDKPMNVDYEFLGKTKGLTAATLQAAYKVRQYINGGYRAQYQFQIVYRVIAGNADERLSADEMLNGFGDWAEQNPPTLPEGLNRCRVKRDNGASIMARYDNNAEDHAIQLTLSYEVI